MILLRGLVLTRFANNIMKNLVFQNKRKTVNKQITRYSHNGEYLYRKSPDHIPKNIALEIVGGIIWWWILWHVYKDFDELIGHSFPDPSKWTDEELGIPPIDDE